MIEMERFWFYCKGVCSRSIAKRWATSLKITPYNLERELSRTSLPISTLDNISNIVSRFKEFIDNDDIWKLFRILFHYILM